MPWSPTNPPEPTLGNFVAAFHTHPQWAVSAPGRVNLMGEHVDYNDGCVLPAAINRHVTMAAAPAPDNRIRLRTSHYPGERILDLTALPSRQELAQDWARYPMGVLSGFLRLGARIPSLDVYIDSTVPFGGGLSSSAALEVAFATLLEEVADRRLAPKQKALLCQRAEHEFAGVPCGIMDQFTSVLSQRDHLLHIDCRSLETTPVPFHDPEVLLLLANTRISHDLAFSEYPRRKSECDRALKRLGVPSWRSLEEDDLPTVEKVLSGVSAKRARHVISEMARTRAAIRSIENQDWSHLGQLMFASHHSLAHDYEVSCPELDCLVAAAREIGPEGGVLGSRMTGAGFGGSTVSLVRRQDAESVMQRYQDAYQRHTGQPLETFITRPAEGARSHTITPQP